MIQRIISLITAFINGMLGKVEKSNVHELRAQKVNESAENVSKAQKALSRLQGAVRQATREVSRLEGSANRIQKRKTHFMDLVKAAAPESDEASASAVLARKHHGELDIVNKELNAARDALVGLTNEYQSNREIVVQAQEDVQSARTQGKSLERRASTAKSRSEILKTSQSLRGLSGVGDTLADLDDSIMEGIDDLEGAAFVATEFANAANAGQRLDAEIAEQESLDDFDAELAAMAAIPKGDSSDSDSSSD